MSYDKLDHVPKECGCWESRYNPYTAGEDPPGIGYCSAKGRLVDAEDCEECERERNKKGGPK